MRQSNGYIIGFTLVLTIVCAGLLAGVSSALKDKIKIAKDNDKKNQILNAYKPVSSGGSISDAYDNNVIGMIVNNKGEVVSTDSKLTFDVDIKKEFRNLSNADKMKLPVFAYRSVVDTSQIAAYIIPIYGNGLWDKIWGFIAIDGSDLNTVKGAVFDHLSETPGLGARITEKVGEVKNAFPGRFVDKKIYDENGKFMSIKVLKGDGNTVISENEVDGLSGATMTANGVNEMLTKYLKLYTPFLNKKRAEVEKNSGKNKSGIRNLMQ